MIRLLLLALLFGVLASTEALAQTHPLEADPPEELDRRSERYVRNRRVAAIVIVGSTLIAGFASSVIRRRRKKQALVAGTPPIFDVHTLLHADVSQRTDILRKAIRDGSMDAEMVSEQLGTWIAIYEQDTTPGFRVLVLESLDGIEDPNLEVIRRAALSDDTDSLRLEALRQLCASASPDADELAHRALDDPSVEVRLFAAEQLIDTAPSEVIDAIFQLIELESRGPYEGHALRRGLSLLAEDLADPTLIDRVESLRESCDDPEGMIDWAIERLRSTR